MTTKLLKETYKNHLIDAVAQHLIIKMIPVLIIMFAFVYNDVFFIESIASACTRLIVIIPVLMLIALKLFLPKNKKTIFLIYHLLLSIAPLMMYAKIIIHLDDISILSSSISGAILVLFIVSLEIRTNYLNAAAIYLIPFSAFIAYLLYINTGFDQVRFVLINIFPIIILGYLSNLLVNKLIYKSFRLSHSLKLEKQKIEDQNKELEYLNATKNRFFSIISHDLRAPFSSIIGFSELLNKNFDSYPIPEQKRLINKIHISSKLVFNLLDNLLKWSKLQLEGMTISKSTINIHSLIDEIMDPFCTLAKDKKIKILNTTAQELSIEADENIFRTVLGNLINNAIKFSFENSSIIISVEILKNHAQFSVKDHGVGIDESAKNKLFNIEEGNSTLGTNNEKGTGLGLLLCKELIELDKGEIWLESETNKGSTFFFTLPIS